MNRWGIGWDGQMDITPNGDYYLVQDVVKLTDELEALRKKVAGMDAGIRVAPQPTGARGRLGYMKPTEAARYLSGKVDKIIVYRGRRHYAPMPAYFNDSPSMFMADGKMFPPLRSWVEVSSGRGRVSSYSKTIPGAINVKLMAGGMETATEWEFVNND